MAKKIPGKKDPKVIIIGNIVFPFPLATLSPFQVTVYPLALDDDVATRKKTVGTHTSYMSCCLFPGSDNQVQHLLVVQ